MIPKLILIKEIPKTLPPQAIKKAVEDFLVDVGFTNQEGHLSHTLQKIANATYLRGNGDFWVAVENSEIVSYVLAHYDVCFDNQLTYWVTQAWVSEKLRGTEFTKESWTSIQNHAKRQLCRHIAVTTIHDEDVFCRFLGGGFEKYANILVTDLDG